MNWPPTVKTIVDGIDTASAATINPIIATLANRDQYIFERLNDYSDKSVLKAYGITIKSSLIGVSNIHPVVYYQPVTSQNTAALDAAICTYSPSIDPQHLLPAQSAFVFGIVDQIYENANSADVWLEGLINFDPVASNCIDAQSAASNITSGPMYLSSVTPGTLTYFPSAASVYVGMNIGDGTFFLKPNIDSLNQLYFNYRVYLFPSVSGTATLTSGHYTISGSDFTLTGWTDATAAVNHYGFASIPTNAKFYYNLPLTTQVVQDTRLSAAQQRDALLLKEALPPYPAAYTNLFVNGVLQTQFEANRTSGSFNDTSAGVYIINDDGIWWCDDRQGYIPWTAGDNTVLVLLQTTKFNPAFKSTVLTSLTPFKDGSNDSTKVLSFLDKSTKQPATTGDILAKFNIGVINQGNITWATGKTVNNVSYDQLSGNLILSLGDSISSIAVGSGLSITNNQGAVTLNLANYVLSGEVADLEPEESDFVYKGLHSFLRLRNPVGAQRSGFTGRILIPQIFPVNTPLTLSLMAFGDTQNNNNAQFLFQYSISQVSSTASINDSVITGNNGASIIIPGWQQNKVLIYKLDNSSNPYFSIPAANLVANSFLNFRITRVASNGSYTGNINVIGIFWTIS